MKQNHKKLYVWTAKRKFKNGTRVLSPSCRRGTVEASFRDAETFEWIYVVKMDEILGGCL